MLLKLLYVQGIWEQMRCFAKDRKQAAGTRSTSTLTQSPMLGEPSKSTGIIKFVALRNATLRISAYRADSSRFQPKLGVSPYFLLYFLVIDYHG